MNEAGSVRDAVAKANSTDYGLTAGIFARNKKEVKTFFDGIQFGVAYANRSGGSTTGAWPGAQSFTGWKASGVTGRGVGSPFYLLNFVRDQSQTTVVKSTTAGRRGSSCSPRSRGCRARPSCS